MTTCLDTNVLVDILNGKKPVLRERYEAELGRGQGMVVSSLAAHELLFGAMISRRPDFHTEQARRILANHEIIDLSAVDAFAAARLRAQLRWDGVEIGSFDTLIAGQALHRGWTFVTANTRHFSRVEGLSVQDWSRSAGGLT